MTEAEIHEIMSKPPETPIPPDHVRYRGVVMSSKRFTRLGMLEIRAEIERDLPSLPAEERERVKWVKRMSRDIRNAKALVRFAYVPRGPMSPSRAYAMALCRLRGWRFSAAEIE